MSATFRAVVKEAFVATVKKAGKPDDYPGILAVELRELLRREGYSIHRRGECIHPRGEDARLGREMTPEEREQFGFAREVHGDEGIG